MDGFGQVGGVDAVGGGEVGDGAGDFENAVEGAGGEAEALEGGVEQRLAAGASEHSRWIDAAVRLAFTGAG